MRCSACEFANPPGMRFCGNCGGPLAGPDEAPAEPPARAPEIGGERRQITVLFCDLVGSTALSEQLDPEQLVEVMGKYQKVATEVIERFDGHVAQILGDGLLVYFGYPQAHEDDARRSVHTGLGVVEAVAGLGETMAREGGPQLSVRVGIHTGNVVAGEIGTRLRRENLALGQTPNVAARVLSLAEPGTVVVGEVTRGLVQGFFHFESLGPQELKGVSRPLEVFRVMGETGVSDRFTATLGRGLTPLVGRSEEMDMLVRCFDRSREGDGQVVFVSGEAGVGKSRLLHDLTERIEPVAGAWWTCRGTPFTQNSAFSPLIELVQDLLRFESDDSPRRKIRKLEEGLVPYRFQTPDAVSLLAALLSLPLNGSHPPLNMTPQRQKERTFEVLLSILLRDPVEPPVVVLMEDLHWVDPSTLDFLESLLDRTEGRRVFVLLTSRPSFDPPWRGRPHLTHLRLDRLSEAQAESLMSGLTGGRRLPHEVVRRVVEKTDGVPLYVEEVTKNLLESGLLLVRPDHYEISEPLTALTIPTTLRDSLTARLDRLGTAREVAQLASVVGRVFSYEMLAAVSPLEDAALTHELERLVDAELVYPTASPREFVFKHALIQDAAHASLLKSQRRTIHEKIARLIEERYPALAENSPEVLARHFEEARLPDKALDYRRLAGQFAVDRSAYVEAVSHFTQALELVESLPPSRRRKERELAATLSLGMALIATKGYAADDVGKTFDRARELAEELGDTPLPLLWGIWLFQFLRGDREATGRLTDQLAQLAGVDELHRFVGHTAQGMRAIFVGDFAAARRHCETAVGLFDSVGPDLEAPKLVDAGLYAHLYAAWSLVFLGRPDQARTEQMDTLKMAEELADPFAVASGLIFAVATAFERRETGAVRELAERCIDVATEQGFPHWVGLGRCAYGWASIREGSSEDVEQILEGVTAYEATGARLPLSYWLSYAVDALLVVGRKEEGLVQVDRALAMARKYLDSFYEGELLRLKGELHLLAPADETAAEQCFREAIDIARRQHASLFELRAATSLSRLFRRRGEPREAREMLRRIYDAFDEGFDTFDLLEAEKLLAELS